MLYGPPPEGIHAARIYARFWDSNAEVHRSSILAVLTLSNRAKESGLLEQINPELLRHAKKGIKAIFHSTAAFHNLTGKMLITTDLAHQHCINIITLVALRKNSVLGDFVPWEKLQRVVKGGGRMFP